MFEGRPQTQIRTLTIYVSEKLLLSYMYEQIENFDALPHSYYKNDGASLTFCTVISIALEVFIDPSLAVTEML